MTVQSNIDLDVDFDPYEEYYLNELDSRSNADTSQNLQSIGTTTTTMMMELYYRSLNEQLPQLNPVAPSQSSLDIVRKRLREETDRPLKRTKVKTCL